SGSGGRAGAGGPSLSCASSLFFGSPTGGPAPSRTTRWNVSFCSLPPSSKISRRAPARSLTGRPFLSRTTTSSITSVVPNLTVCSPAGFWDWLNAGAVSDRARIRLTRHFIDHLQGCLDAHLVYYTLAGQTS